MMKNVDNNLQSEQNNNNKNKVYMLHARKFIVSMIVIFGVLPIFGQQGKKATLMILPSDNWCVQRYFTTTYEDQGRTIVTPDYPTAFREDAEIGGVISKIGEMLTAKGYSLKDCEQEFKSLQNRIAEDNVTMSSTSAASLAESPLDILKRRTKADIIIQVGWQVNNEKSGRSITFTIEAFDTYTSKRIATATSTNKASNEIIPRQLEKAVSKKINDFDSQMMSYYTDLQKNGREIIMTIRCWDNWENNLETEFGNDELLDLIQDWLNANTVNSAFNLTDATETMAQFEQIRIPFFDEKNKALDARSFATKLRKYLAQEPYFVSSKVLTRGLGEVVLILGEK